MESVIQIVYQKEKKKLNPVLDNLIVYGVIVYGYIASYKLVSYALKFSSDRARFVVILIGNIILFGIPMSLLLLIVSSYIDANNIFALQYLPFIAVAPCFILLIYAIYSFIKLKNNEKILKEEGR